MSVIEVVGPPSRWVVKGGRPADVCWEGHDGIPSYGSDTGKILVYDLLLAAERVGGDTMLVSRDYGMVATRSVLVGDHELCALHDDPGAAWVWRPLIYTVGGGGLTRLGSQQELEWRWSLQEMQEARQDVGDRLGDFMVGQALDLRRRYGRMPPLALEPGGRGFRLPKNARKRMYRDYVAFVEREWERPPDRLPFMDANERAEAILREHLNPQQRLDLEAHGQFYVRGTINRLYVIRPGDGAAIVNPSNRHEWVSLCLHPERWMPHADVALATKLAIESGPDGEEEMLAGARTRALGQGPAPTGLDRAAWQRERDLLPAPIGAVA